MPSMPLLRPILMDETLTRNLGDEEARMLIEWVVEWAELYSQTAANEQQARDLIQRLIRRARGISRFVQLWTQHGSRAAALQLLATERFHWPLPTEAIEPADLMKLIIEYENEFPDDRQNGKAA